MLSEEEVKDIIEGTLSGKYHAENLPYNLFKFTAGELLRAFETGWQQPVFSDTDVYSADEEMFSSFRKNLWYFSANKTSKQVAELNALIHDEEGNRRSRSEFTKEALKVDKTFNERYIEVEYDMTVKLAHSGREWRDIEDTKEQFPILEWVVVMDENTRHAEFNGIKLSVDHPFWNSHTIPYDWGCRCRLRQHSKATVTTEIPDVAEPSPLFRNNVYKSREVWKNEDHPYGQDLSKKDKKGIENLITKAEKDLKPEKDE